MISQVCALSPTVNPEPGLTTIRDMAGHVSKQILKHYSHIRTEAKRRAVDSPVVRPNVAPIPDESAKVNQIK
jgi:hypothetical protein